MSDFRNTPAIVKPRKPYNETRCIIAVAGDLVLLESTGEVFTRAELPLIIARQPGSIVACENAARLLLELEAFFQNIPGWSWRMTPVQRRVYRQHAATTRPTETKDAIVNYFGFRYPVGNEGRYKTHYHYPIDTLTFLSGNSFQVLAGRDRLQAIYEWGVDVRNFCTENRLKISSTSGGLAAQLLRDERFFPEARRKVPKATNQRARDHLPGNHYELFVPDDSTIRDAIYLDMKGAHHYAATRLTFPDPNRMYGRGRFRNPPEEWRGHAPWARQGTPKYRAMIVTHGLFLLRVNVPSHLSKSRLFPPPWLRRPAGTALVWVYSNEIPLISQHGAIIEGIEAAWTAGSVTDGLNRYAEWAIRETSVMPTERRAWAKPTLLAVYGLLAARPRAREFGYRDAVKGESKIYPTFGGPVAVSALRTSREIESPVVNVILRGMIEAQVRMEVLSLATMLDSYGLRVLALYADSVIIEPTAAMPFLPHPWVVKTALTNVTFFNPVSFVSDELERLPGISREGAQRIARRSMWRAHLAARNARNAAIIASGGTVPPPPIPWATNRLEVLEKITTRHAGKVASYWRAR